MDLGRDVLTRTLIGNTDAEKVFTTWWVTLHHYLVYFLVILGLIAIPLDSMLSVNGNCSYKFDSTDNYLLPGGVCRIENRTIVVEHKVTKQDAWKKQVQIFHMSEVKNITTSRCQKDQCQMKHFKSDTYAEYAMEKTINFERPQKNFLGCDIKPNPKLFGFYVYWACVNQKSTLALYFPYLVLTLAFVLVLLERIFTRYMWTGQRIEKFYDILVKDVLANGDIEELDTKENRQRCRQIHYDFKGSSIYSKAYTVQTIIKLMICLGIIMWSIFNQCHSLRKDFANKLQCKVFDYVHECAIPSNGLNLVIFDMVNLVLFVILVVVAYNLNYHLKFKQPKYIQKNEYQQNNLNLVWVMINELKDHFRKWRSTKLTGLIYSYFETLVVNNNSNSENQISKDETKMLHELYFLSPDMQMLLNLLAEKEGMWASILILSLFDKSFKNEFKVTDSQITSHPNASSSRRRDVTISWNEPKAAVFIAKHVSTEHLMYVLEIDPPLDTKKDEDGVTMMPACTTDGGCVFNVVRKTSEMEKLDCKDFEDDMSRKSSSASTITFANNPDKAMTIIDGGFVEEALENNDNNVVIAEKRNKISTASAHIINLRRKTAIQLLHGRKKSADKVRKFKSTMKGLRNDTEYVIKISFVLSGRKLGSESYRILCNNPGGTCQSRKSSTESSVSSSSSSRHDSTPKSSLANNMSGNGNNDMDQIVSSKMNPLPSIDEHFLTAESSEEVKIILQRRSTDALLNHQRFVILEFVASWCGFCKKIEPQIEELAELFNNKSSVTNDGIHKEVLFIKADVEQCSEMATAFDVNVVPAFLIIEQLRKPSSEDGKYYFDGKINSTYLGEQLPKINDDIKNWLSDSTSIMDSTNMSALSQKHR